MAGCTELEVEVQPRDGGGVVLRLRGDLDIDSAARLRLVLDQALADGEVDIDVDIAGVGFVDSTGIGLFIRTSKQLADRGRLRLLSPQPGTRRAIEMMGLHRLLY